MLDNEMPKLFACTRRFTQSPNSGESIILIALLDSSHSGRCCFPNHVEGGVGPIRYETLMNVPRGSQSQIATNLELV
jgi:hypothetical protein